MSGARRGGSSRVVATAFAVLTIGLAACNSDPTEVQLQVIEEVTFAASLGVDLAAMTKLPEGMYIQDRVMGSGPGLAAGDTAWVYYELYLHTGTPISSDLFRFEFRRTPPAVIQGWDIGLEGMMAGGARLLVIPPELAYGSRAVGSIPAGSILVFEVELDSIS